MNGSSIVINKDSDVEDLVTQERTDRIYLKDLGYENLMVKGPFNQEIILDINIPKNKVVAEGSKIKFDVRYAENLDFDRSLMTVYLNDIPIGSKRLYIDKADNDTFEATIPSDVLGKSYYQVKVAFDLNVKDLQCVTRDVDNPWAYIVNTSYIQFDYESDVLGKSYYQVKVAFDLNVKDLQCVTRDVDNPWAYIVNTSYIQFDYDDNNELTFSNYPYPFVLDSNFNDLKIIIPDTMTSNDLSNVSNIVSFMGRDTKYNLGNVQIIKDSEFNKDDNKANVIIYGTPTTNNILKDINSKLNLKFNGDFSSFESNDKIKFIGEYSSQSKLNLKFNGDFSAFESNDKIKFIGEYSSQIASIQLIKSPYNSDFGAMVISATDNNDLNLATSYLNEIKFIGEYSSQIASIQLIKSPYNSDFGAMVISATDNNDLNLATSYLNDLSLTKSLRGDTVVIDRNGSVEDLYYNTKEKVDEIKGEKIKVNKEGEIFIIVAIGLFITIAIVVIMMLKKYRK